MTERTTLSDNAFELITVQTGDTAYYWCVRRQSLLPIILTHINASNYAELSGARSLDLFLADGIWQLGE